MNKYIYNGPTMLFKVGACNDVELCKGMGVWAEVNINIATIKGIIRDGYELMFDPLSYDVAAKYLKPVKPETIDFKKDDNSFDVLEKKINELFNQKGFVKELLDNKDKFPFISGIYPLTEDGKRIDVEKFINKEELLKLFDKYNHSKGDTTDAHEAVELSKSNDADKKSAQHVVDMIMDDFSYTIFRSMTDKGYIYQALKRIQDNSIPRREAEKLFNDDDHEVGGNHYSKMVIEPWDYIYANKLGFDEGLVVKYISRHKDKNGAEDVKKVISFCKHILKTQYGED